MSNRILITGASGFIGKHLLDKLIQTSAQIACVDLYFNQAFIENYGKRVHLFCGNLLDKAFVTSFTQIFSPEYVFHLAGSKNRTNILAEFSSSHEINFLGTLNLLEVLIDIKDIKLITMLGTIEEYGNSILPFKEDSQELPNSAYGLSKLSATKLAIIFNRQFNLPVVIFRPSIVYGPNQGEEMFIPALINTLLRKLPFRMTEGKQLRDFIYIDDLIEALLKTINNKNLGGQVINIASGHSKMIRDVAGQIAKLLNSIENLKVGEIPYRNFEIMDYSVDIAKAASYLDWHAKTTLSIGIEKTISFYQKIIYDEA